MGPRGPFTPNGPMGPGPGPGGPGVPPYGYPPAPRQQRRRPKVIIGIAVPVVVGLFIAARALSPGTSTPTGDWKAGQCVSPEGRIGDQAGKAFHRTGCDATEAKAKITKMTSVILSGSPTNCPEDTDAMVSVDQSGSHSINVGHEVACIRNLRAPHPGDVGQGGGLFRAGDCILDPGQSSSLKETPCASPHWATVVQWAANSASCPKGGSYDAVPILASSRALCVRRD
jgi:hypothetical protein